MYRYWFVLLGRLLRFRLYFWKRGYLGRSSTLNFFGKITIGNNVNIGSSVKINIAKGGVLIIGDNVHIGDFCQIEVEKLVIIEDDVTLSDNVFVADVTHAIPVVDGAGIRRKILTQSVTIGTGTWIGRNTTVNPGISVSARNVIASNSVITKTMLVEDFLIGGQPASPIKSLGQKKI